MVQTKQSAEAINIGPQEQLKRRLMGKFAIAFAGGLVLTIVGADWPRWARLFLFIPVWMGALGIGQAKDKVCIGLAIRGVSNMDHGEQSVDDPLLKKSLKEKASRIHRRAVIIAALVTLAFVASPPY